MAASGYTNLENYLNGLVAVMLVMPAVRATETGLRVFPNPATGQFTLLHPLAGPAAAVQVLDTLGRVALTQVVSAVGSQTVIQLTTLPAGLYVLRYADAGRCLTAKFCRQ